MCSSDLKERRYAEYKARKERERWARRAAKKAQAEREAREKAGTVCLAGAEERAGTADSKEGHAKLLFQDDTAQEVDESYEDMKKSIATAQGGLPMDVSQVY